MQFESRMDICGHAMAVTNSYTFVKSYQQTNYFIAVLTALLYVTHIS